MNARYPMYRTLLALVAIVTCTSSARAGGVDLSIDGCPGNPGAQGGFIGIVDPFPPDPTFTCIDQSPNVRPNCATGAPISLTCTWAPQQAIPDLIAIDVDVYCCVPAGLDNTPFWNLDGSNGCNGAGLNVSHRRVAGCTTPAYADVWNVANAGSAITGFRTGATTERIRLTCFRPTSIAVAANQRLFGAEIIIDGSTAAEAGGACQGCCAQIQMAASCQPYGENGDPQPALQQPTGFSQGFTSEMILQGSPASCSPVHSRSVTWGQMKSLYR